MLIGAHRAGSVALHAQVAAEHVLVSCVRRVAVHTNADLRQIVAGAAGVVDVRVIILVMAVEAYGDIRLHSAVVAATRFAIAVFVRRVEIGIHEGGARFDRAVGIVTRGAIAAGESIPP